MLRYDSPVMEMLGTAADYVILNLLCLLLCIPVISVGAAQTAKYDVAMRIVRGEDPPVARAFFSSFRKNFGQAGRIWLILAVILGLLGADWFLILRKGINSYSFIYLLLLGLITYMMSGTFFSVFPMIARFQMRTGEALKGAAIFSVIHLPRTLLGIFLMFLPYLLSYYYLEWGLAIWFLCTGTALYYNSRMFVGVFAKLEEQFSSGEEAADAGDP